MKKSKTFLVITVNFPILVCTHISRPQNEDVRKWVYKATSLSCVHSLYNFTAFLP